MSDTNGLSSRADRRQPVTHPHFRVKCPWQGGLSLLTPFCSCCCLFVLKKRLILSHGLSRPLFCLSATKPPFFHLY